jgi:hypothetical protein
MSGVIAGFLVKNATTGETEAVLPGNPRFDACLGVVRLMGAKDLTELCRTAKTARDEELEKQAVGLGERLGLSAEEALKSGWPLGQSGENRIRKILRRRTVAAALAGGGSAIATNALIRKMKRKSDRPSDDYGGVYTPEIAGYHKQAAYTPHAANNELLERLRKKAVSDGTSDA